MTSYSPSDSSTVSADSLSRVSYACFRARQEAAGKFLVEVWLVEALKIVTNLTLRAAEATYNFRVELAARLYFRQLYMQHDGPFETFDGTPILLDDAARLCSLEVHEDGDESADVAAVNAVVTSWRTGTTPSPRLP